ncbi:MAG: nickel pincer cofactor biosynthesis protein LarC [Acidimicrobiales bacterium]
MTRLLWINPALGVAGDMLLAALLDAGSDEAQVRDTLGLLGLEGWRLTITEERRRSIVCRRARVEAVATEHRPWSRIDHHLATADLPAGVAAGSRATFRRLAEVESARHGVSLDEVHFHEVGAVDALIDIVGCWAALASLGIDLVASGPVGLGVGTVEAAHGRLPHPAPATTDLLTRAEALVRGVDIDLETTTPTGAALLVSMVERWGPMPAGRLVASGLGAGHRDPDTHPNVVGVHVVEPDGSSVVGSVIIETTVDDVTPEVLGHVVDRALAMGADDAWVVPVVMKKSRPAHQLRVLCAPPIVGDLVDLLARETGTLGLRTHEVTKHTLARRVDRVRVEGFDVAVKVGPHGAKPEHDDLVRVAAGTGCSVRAAAAEVLRLWSEQTGGQGS